MRRPTRFLGARRTVVGGLLASMVAALTISAQAAPPGGKRPDPSGILHGAPIRGMFLSDRGADEDNLILADLPRLKAIGINTIPLYLFLHSPSVDANTVSTGPETTPTAKLRSLIIAIHDMRMAVDLVPYVRIDGPHVWRGYLEPTKPHAWFKQYRAVLHGYETLAENLHVELFTIGTELATLQQDTYRAEWSRLITEARSTFHGSLTYESSSGQQAAQQMTWWNWVDIIGVSAYYSLSSKPNPPIVDLERAWNNGYLPPLRALSKKFHRKLMFGEVGYVSNALAAYHPATIWMDPTIPRSFSAQATAYDALLTVTETQNWFAGVQWFHWSPPQKSPNRGYTPRDKPAECVLARHYVPTRPWICRVVQHEPRLGPTAKQGE